MFTWSVGCTLLPRRRHASSAINSLAFMFIPVPEPVWKTSTTTESSNLPPTTSSPALMIASPVGRSRSPSEMFVLAAATFMIPIACTILLWKRVPVSRKTRFDPSTYFMSGEIQFGRLLSLSRDEVPPASIDW